MSYTNLYRIPGAERFASVRRLIAAPVMRPSPVAPLILPCVRRLSTPSQQAQQTLRCHVPVLAVTSSAVLSGVTEETLKASDACCGPLAGPTPCQTIMSTLPFLDLEHVVQMGS